MTAKRGLTLGTCDGVLASRTRGWSLCVGAGTSLPVFPTWEALSRRLAGSLDDGEGEADQLFLRGFSSDAAVAAVQDRANEDDITFTGRIARSLYADVKEAFGSDWRRAARVLASRAPGDLQAGEWRWFLDRFEQLFPTCNALRIAQLLTQLPRSLRPNAVISFNAEPLLYALVHGIWATSGLGGSEGPSTLLADQTSALSDRRFGRIPYYFCHGRLPVPDVQPRASRTVSTLVFSEWRYLALANASYSWSSAAFTSVTSSSSCVFIGLSMTDSNIRRWLGWQHQERIRELGELGVRGAAATSHYWINKKPETAAQQRWIESVVAHLGVRLVWIDAWADASTALKGMLGRGSE